MQRVILHAMTVSAVQNSMLHVSAGTLQQYTLYSSIVDITFYCSRHCLFGSWTPGKSKLRTFDALLLCLYQLGSAGAIGRLFT
jgi:hypothetical protein